MNKNTVFKRGVTLVELTVVLVILAAIAGITVPLVSDLTAEAHGGTSTANLQNINTTIAQFNAKNGSHPDNYDSLMQGAAGSEEVSDLLEQDLPDNPHGLTVLTLSGDQADSLIAAGISQIHALAPLGSANNPTFDPYSGAVYDIATNLAAVQIPSATVNEQLNADASETYVIFGFGAKNDAIGKNMLEAPVHYPHNGRPQDSYNRYLVVYQLGEDEEDPAKFVGTLANDEGNLVGVNSHLEEFFSN